MDDRNGLGPQGGYIAKITNDARETEMEENMGQVNTMIGNLRNMALDMGSELENQNRQIDRINRKVSSAAGNGPNTRANAPRCLWHAAPPCCITASRFATWHGSKPPGEQPRHRTPTPCEVPRSRERGIVDGENNRGVDREDESGGSLGGSSGGRARGPAARATVARPTCISFPPNLHIFFSRMDLSPVNIYFILRFAIYL